jgi:hypothetical protein
MPYGIIGLGIAFLLGVWAAIMAETTEGRIAFITVMVVLFLFPSLWPGRTGSLIGGIGWILFGLYCVIFLKWKGLGIRG